MQDRFYLRYVYNNKIYDIFAVDFFNKTAQLVSLNRAETLFAKIDTDKLIQCTGLRDKNGKLIFEEDFVIEKLDGFKDCKKVVYWIGDAMTGFNLNSEGEYEVIGNIYENPELLEDRG